MDRPENFPGGKPPKSIEQIRSAVESIHRNTAAPTGPGPLTQGLPDDERVVLATFHDAALCGDFQQRLLAAGVMSSIRKQRRMTLLSVDIADRARAAELLREYERDHPDRPQSDRRPWDFTLFGVLVGGTFGFIVQGGEVPSWPRAIVLMAAFMLFGGLTGSLFDVSSHRYRHTGRLQFGLGEVMAVTALLAIVFLLRRVM